MTGIKPLATPSREYVGYPVPVEFIDEVTALVAKLNAQRTFGTVPGPDDLDPMPAPDSSVEVSFPAGGPADPVGKGSASTEVGNPNGVWTVVEFQTLAEAGTASSERVVRVLRALGEAGSDVLMSTSALVDATGVQDTYLRSALSKLTRFVATRPAVYGDVVWWPFGWKYGATVDAEHPREFHYYFSAEQHSAWVEAVEQGVIK